MLGKTIRFFAQISFQIVFFFLFSFSVQAQSGTEEIEESSWLDDIVFHQPFSSCSGECGVHFYSGAFVQEPMEHVLGVEGLTPVWDWQMGNSGIFAAALSRPLVSFGDFAEISGEIGAAQRFGDLTSQEVWGALYFYWTAFPWNDYVKTRIGVSTGLNYAAKLDRVEVSRSGNGEGSRLMHFLSPEVAFSLPEKSDTELVLRFHHRSGGKEYWGDTDIFNSTLGGAQYMTIGLRFHF